MKLVIISGRSGSGKSTVLHTLEDEGFYCVDNLPASMLSQLADTLKGHSSEPPRMAVSVDVRNLPGVLDNFSELLTLLRKKGIECQVVYLDTDSDKLVSRYSATRRKHPLSNDQRSLKEAIELEKKLLKPVLIQADFKIDTTRLSVHQIRDQIKEDICGSEKKSMTVLFQSFGFKNGIPSDADFIFDVAVEQGVLANKPSLTSINTDQYPTPAKRPSNSRLSTEKITLGFSVKASDWKAALNNVQAYTE